MDDPLLMRVLHGVADGDEELEPLRGREVGLVAVIGDANAAHQFHDEEWPARGRRASIEHLRDVRMVHHCQRLPLLLKARDDLLRIHAHLDDLQRHAPPHRLLLIRHPHHAEATFADLLVPAPICATGFDRANRIVARQTPPHHRPRPALVLPASVVDGMAAGKIIDP